MVPEVTEKVWLQDLQRHCRRVVILPCGRESFGLIVSPVCDRRGRLFVEPLLLCLGVTRLRVNRRARTLHSADDEQNHAQP